MAEFNGSPRGAGRRIVVVASRFNEGITMPLAEGAVAALVGQGVNFEDIDVLWVPGAWEIPVAVRRALATAHAIEVRVVPMSQGQKQSRLLAWTFQDSAARRTWRARP